MKRKLLRHTLQVRVDDDLHRALARAARREGVDESRILRRALRRELGLNGAQEETS